MHDVYIQSYMLEPISARIIWWIYWSKRCVILGEPPKVTAFPNQKKTSPSIHRKACNVLFLQFLHQLFILSWIDHAWQKASVDTQSFNKDFIKTKPEGFKVGKHRIEWCRVESCKTNLNLNLAKPTCFQIFEKLKKRRDFQAMRLFSKRRTLDRH